MVLNKQKKLFILFSGELRFFEQNFFSISENLKDFEKYIYFILGPKKKIKLSSLKNITLKIILNSSLNIIGINILRK